MRADGRAAWLEQLVAGASRSRRAVAGAGGVLLVVFFLIELITGTPREPATIAYVVPVALVALALGAVAGIAAAILGIGLYWLGSYVDGHTLSAGHVSYRLAALAFLAAVVGALASRLAESELHAQLEHELRARAVELNDTVVQGLALSRYQLDGGDAAGASRTLQRTIGRAQELVADLMGDVEPEPGALRRARSADLGGTGERLELN